MKCKMLHVFIWLYITVIFIIMNQSKMTEKNFIGSCASESWLTQAREFSFQLYRLISFFRSKPGYSIILPKYIF